MWLPLAAQTDPVLVVALALDGVDLAQAMPQGVVHHPASRLLRARLADDCRLAVSLGVGCATYSSSGGNDTVSKLWAAFGSAFRPNGGVHPRMKPTGIPTGPTDLRSSPSPTLLQPVLAVFLVVVLLGSCVP